MTAHRYDFTICNYDKLGHNLNVFPPLRCRAIINPIGLRSSDFRELPYYYRAGISRVDVTNTQVSSR
ncbi:protein of unknown function [Candidatus Promineifilum breve]|uniref:Uncharacterized protein n=1 Tax=Candidatus Promineifilum breve TaxID=1806508 RepID=A0A160T351_9CHLR|nr:protein of unknown function [Candidatus Promineifilum breve]